MIAKEIQLAEIFEGNMVYVSPSFQRPYSWVEGACEKVLHAIIEVPEKPFFLGALVTFELTEKAAGLQKVLLIDGNLRLMTILLFLLALRDTLAPLDGRAAEDIQRCCFINASVQSPVPILRNVVMRADRGVFEALVFHQDLCKYPKTHPILEVYQVAKNAFQKWTREELTHWRERFLYHFTFVELSLGKDEDPYPIFKLCNPQENEFTRVGANTYTQFSSDPELMGLIAGGESQEVEFKERAITLTKHEDTAHIQGVNTIVRAVAGFMNSQNGGILLIGISDDGKILGVERDYVLADKGKSNWDGYELFLANRLRAKLDSKNAFLYYKIERHSAQSHDVCMIRVAPAEEPTYIEKHFYVRTNNQTIEMLGPDLVDYVNVRFATRAQNAEVHQEVFHDVQ